MSDEKMNDETKPPEKASKKKRIIVVLAITVATALFLGLTAKYAPIIPLHVAKIFAQLALGIVFAAAIAGILGLVKKESKWKSVGIISIILALIAIGFFDFAWFFPKHRSFWQKSELSFGPSSETKPEKKEAAEIQAAQEIPLICPIEWVNLKGQQVVERLQLPNAEAVKKARVGIIFTDGLVKELSWEEFLNLPIDKPLHQITLWSSPKKEEVIQRVEIFPLDSAAPPSAVAVKPAEQQSQPKANWLSKAGSWLKNHWLWFATIGGVSLVLFIVGFFREFFRDRRRKKLHTFPVRSP